MSEKYRRIGQDAWVEMGEPVIDSYWEDDNDWNNDKYYKDLAAYNNRTHHPIANLESGWWKEGEVKGDDECLLEETCKHNGTCKKERCLTHPCDEKIKVFKPQPTTENYNKDYTKLSDSFPTMKEERKLKEMTDSKDNTPEYYNQLMKNYRPYSGEIIGAGNSPSILKQVEDLWKFLPDDDKKQFLSKQSENNSGSDGLIP